MWPVLPYISDLNPSMERAWIELEGIEAIVKTASKAKFFIEFHSCCLEGMSLVIRRSSFHLKHCESKWQRWVFSSQTHNAQVKMTHRAVMCQGFSNLAGPPNNCQRLEAQSILIWLKICLLIQLVTCVLCLFGIASSSCVQHGVSSRSAPAVVCQVMWRVWVIRSVTGQSILSFICHNSYLYSLVVTLLTTVLWITFLNICCRWMLCGSALAYWYIGAVRDISESPRWRDGLYKGSSPGPRAHRKARNTREDIRWVSQSCYCPTLPLACTITSY